MSKFVAAVALIAASGFIGLGNMYYTYGIWPKSWWAFAIFWVLGMIVYGLLSAIKKED